MGWKRPELALEALALLPDARLRVVGEPLLEAGHRLLDDLRRRARRPDLAGRVEFVGAVEDPVPELSAAACLLHCADAEPFGRVVAEALASGVPVVAPSAGGPAEVVDDSCGRLFCPGDARDAARALAAVLGDRERLSAGARDRAEATLDLEDTRRRYRELVPRDPVRPPSEISLVTVIHDSKRELAALLASVDRHLPGTEVVVVDSGSSDGGSALARDRGAKVVELGENVGYGRAVNVGLVEATRPVTIVANPDLELVDGSLAELGAEAGRGPDRLLAPALLRADGTRQDSVHPLPSSAPELAASVLPPAALPGPARLPVEPWLAREPRRVGWAVGACLVARSGLLRRLGPFSTEIFLYGEDLDLCLRGTERGVETWFRPDAPRAAPPRPTPHGATASASSCWPDSVARWSAAAWAPAGQRATTSLKWSRSRTGSRSSVCWAARPSASAASSPRCAGPARAAVRAEGKDLSRYRTATPRRWFTAACGWCVSAFQSHRRNLCPSHGFWLL